MSIVTACAAGTHAIGEAGEMIRRGAAKAMVAGGTESSICEIGMAGFEKMHATCRTSNDHPEKGSRPFDAKRSGFVMGEGAGALILEDYEFAKARGAKILAELKGYGLSADAHHITAPAPGGAGAMQCIELALADAGLTPGDIVHINAHGTGTPLNDAAEAAAISKVFGSPGPAVTSTKGVHGHALGAAGAIEAAAVLLSMAHALIPPTRGHTTPDPELPTIDLVVGEPRSWEPGPTLSNSFGFGGHNGCLVLAPPPTT
jgi:3-oxoacyl-[acyl-carrier-protein] synthase II